MTTAGGEATHADSTHPLVLAGNSPAPQALARIAGVLFLVTFATAIPAYLVLYAPVLSDPGYIVSPGADTSVSWGAFLELILILANIGTAVALFPVLKRVNECLALGYVTARIVECGFIAVGILALLTVVTLRQGAPGEEAAALLVAGKALTGMHAWTFLLGPGFTVGVGNGLILGWLMYRSRLVPRAMALLGLVGGPLIILSGTAVLFGLIGQGSAWQAAATIPEFFWELSLGVWLVARGFNPSALTALLAGSDGAAPERN